MKPVIALVGGDIFLQIEALRQIAADAGADVQRFDVDGETVQIAELLDQLREYSMFGSSKLIIVRTADALIKAYRERLEDYVESPAEEATLVLRCASLPGNQRISKLIAKHGQVISCEPPKDIELPRWIANRGKAAHQINLAPDAAKTLADLIGGDLGKLDNELAKLALQVEGTKATPEDVTASVAFQREQEMWHLTNDLSAGQFELALRRWKQLDQTDPAAAFRAATWLTIWAERLTRVLSMVREKQPPGVIGKELKIWPAKAVDDLIATANRLGPARIDRITDMLAEMDRRSKSGLGEMPANVERVIATLGQV
jgi:DNA polymerase III subunit delta